MSDITSILDRGYTKIWREGRLEHALRGLDDDFEWVVPDYAGGAVRHGADVALATIEMRGTGRVSGVPAELRVFQLWTFRDGRAVRMEMFTDIDEAPRAAGLGAPPAAGLGAPPAAGLGAPPAAGLGAPPAAGLGAPPAP
jgi:hypothetical protein